MSTKPLEGLAQAGGAADPALLAIAAWERAWHAAWGERSASKLFGEDSPEATAAEEAEDAACVAVCATVATTAAGMAAQLRFAYLIFAANTDANAPGYRKDEPYSEPEAYEFGQWSNNRDANLLASLLAGAQGRAEAECQRIADALEEAQADQGRRDATG